MITNIIYEGREFENIKIIGEFIVGYLDNPLILFGRLTLSEEDIQNLKEKIKEYEQINKE